MQTIIDAIYPISGTAVVLAVVAGLALALAGVMVWDHFKKDEE